MTLFRQWFLSFFVHNSVSSTFQLHLFLRATGDRDGGRSKHLGGLRGGHIVYFCICLFPKSECTWPPGPTQFRRPCVTYDVYEKDQKSRLSHYLCWLKTITAVCKAPYELCRLFTYSELYTVNIYRIPKGILQVIYLQCTHSQYFPIQNKGILAVNH